MRTTSELSVDDQEKLPSVFLKVFLRCTFPGSV